MATIDFTWPLFGENGFLNQRKNKASFIQKQIAEINLDNAQRISNLKIRQLLNSIRTIENQVKISSVQRENAQKSFDLTLDQYTAGRTDFLKLKDSLLNLRDSEMNYENFKFDHLSSKVELAQTLGVDDLPSDSFESLGTTGNSK